MKIKNRHTEIEEDVLFASWFYSLRNKEDFIVSNWGDIVYLQTIDKDGLKTDHRIMDRDHAIRVISKDYRKYSLRELEQSEWIEIRNHFHDAPDIDVIAHIPETPVTLSKVEKRFLRYLHESSERVNSTKVFADSNGFTVSTINELADSLRAKHLIATVRAAGRDPDNPVGYVTYYCELTPVAVDMIEEWKVSNQKTTNAEEMNVSGNFKRSRIRYSWWTWNDAPSRSWQVVIAVLAGLSIVMVWLIHKGYI